MGEGGGGGLGAEIMNTLRIKSKVPMFPYFQFDFYTCLPANPVKNQQEFGRERLKCNYSAVSSASCGRTRVGDAETHRGSLVLHILGSHFQPLAFITSGGRIPTSLFTGLKHNEGSISLSLSLSLSLPPSLSLSRSLDNWRILTPDLPAAEI